MKINYEARSPMHYIKYEVLRGICFNEIRKRFYLSDRQLQVIIAGFGVEKSKNRDWKVSDINNIITGSSSTNNSDKIYSLVDEGFVVRTGWGSFKLTSKGRDVCRQFGKSFQSFWKSSETKAEIEEGRVVCLH